MPLQYIFWGFFILFALFDGYGVWANQPNPHLVRSGRIILLILLLCLGWAMFGKPVQG